MEPWTDRRLVRPIPIDDDAASSSEWDPPVAHGEDDKSPKRPWLPLAVAIVAVVVVLGSVASFDGPDELPPPPKDAISLQSTLPGVTDRLTLIANGPTNPTALLWNPASIQPNPVPIEFDTAEPGTYMRLQHASFDAGRDYIAVAAIPDGDFSGIVGVGTRTDVRAVTSIPVATSFLWHATEVGHFAWIEVTADGVPILLTARVDPLSKDLVDEKRVADVASSASELVRWDSDGFVLNTGLGEILALSNSGRELWQVPGRALGAGASTILSVPMDADIDRLISATALDRSGNETGDVFNEEIDDDLLIRAVAISGTTGAVARTDVHQDHTQLKIRGSALIGPVMNVNHDANAQPLRFTSNGEYFVLRADGTNDLLFVDWQRGLIKELSVPDGYDVVGFDFG